MKQIRTRRGWRATTAGLATGALVISGLVAAPAAVAAEDWTGPFIQSEFVTPTLEGCRGSTSSYSLLDPGSPAGPANPYICDDSEYTTGNLQKGWNELDLVPHRLTLDLGNQATATTTYDVIIAGDNSESNGGYEGYDRILVPVLNEAKSDGFCELVSYTAQAEEVGITGGVYDGIYRILRVAQNKGTTCVVEFDMRLSNSSALYSGSSLQGYMFEKDDFSTGKRTVPIPVKEVEPQQLKKSATAVRDQRYGWTIAKEVSPEQVTFADTCEVWESTEAITVKVIWTKVGPAPSGKIRYEAVISAVNPARRDVQVTVTDLVYGGTDATGTPIAGNPFTVGTPKTTVPALSTEIIGTVKVDIEGDFPSIYDIATGVYWDPVLNEEIKPDKTVDLAVAVGAGDLVNGTALVTDTEAITSGFEFKVGATGTWGTSDYWEKEVTDSGSETFTKYVRTTQGYSGNGKLSDTATIQGELDATTQGATGATVLLAKKLATVSVTKSTLDVFEGSESADFTFQLLSEDKLTVVDSKTITVDDTTADDAGKPGYKKSSVDFAKVVSGIYYVKELPTAGWEGNLTPIKVDVTGTTCSAGASFTNDPSPASAKVKKVTDPVGFEEGWSFELWKDGSLFDTATTADDGYVKFDEAFGQGSYEVKEASQAGWESDGGAPSCTFTVDLPGDGGKVFSCTFTNTYKPTITVKKSGDTLAKYYDGDSEVDDIDYTIKVANTSPTPAGPAGAPVLVCTVTDDDINKNKTLSAIGPGEDDSWKPSYELPADPWATTAGEFKNTAMVTCKYGASDGPDAPVNGSTSAVTDSHSTDVFVPSVKVTKTADVDEALVGDTVHWTITAENTSSAKTPDLVFKSFTDTYEPGEGVTNSCTTLAVGDKCTIEYDYIVPKDSGDLANSAKVEFTLDQTVEAWPNVISDTGRDTVDVINPSFTVSKKCTSTQPVPQEGPAEFTVYFENTGDVDLSITADDGIGTFTLAAGAKDEFVVKVDGPLSGSSTVSNTVKATASYKTTEVDWSDTKDSTDKCTVGSRVNILKLTKGVEDPNYNWTFKIFAGPDGFGGTALATDSTPPTTLDFDNYNLDPAKPYTLCETNVYTGWTSGWWVWKDGAWVQITYDPNPTPAVGTVYNPDAAPYPNGQDLGNRCVEIGSGTDYPLVGGETLKFKVDNTYPGGEPRTPGYWKNWASCTSGGQYDNGSGANDPLNEKWTLDEALNTSGGYKIGLMLLDGVFDNDVFPFESPTGGDCVEAVRILDKSDAETDKKMANDAAYELATALLAMRLNYTAMAQTCQAATDAGKQGQELLEGIEFTGTGEYLTPKQSRKDKTTALRTDALDLAKTLDMYNNGLICG